VELKSVLDVICNADTCELVFGISDHLSGNVFSVEFTFVYVCVFLCVLILVGKMGGLESMYLA
jgi:hypothetical protein